MENTLIVNCRIVNEGEVFEGDLLMAKGRIVALGKDLAHRQAQQVVEGGGCYLLPGMIDDHVHFREPGMTHKGDIRSESRAAVAGGITSTMEMPNTLPPVVDLAGWQAKRDIASRNSFTNHAFYIGATAHNLDLLNELDPRWVCGVKLFMGASTGTLCVEDGAVLDAWFERSPVLLAAHCEDNAIIAANRQHYLQRHGEDLPARYHPLIRSAEACYRSTARAVELARRHGSRLHVLHLSTAEELHLFAAGPLEDKRITAEVCVHHLWFCDDDYATLGNRIKCNPAIKSARDREALRQALVADKIDLIATDHAPHTLEEKARPFLQAPSGLPLVQYALPALMELHAQGHFSLPRLVAKTSHAPARLFGIKERGFIRQGYWADLVLVDPARATPLDPGDILYKCGWSPFSGAAWSSSVRATWVSGQLAYRAGDTPQRPRGMPLEFIPR